MNNPNPFVPQGSLLEQQSKRRSRLKYAVLGVSVVGTGFLILMLIQGCKREQVAENQPPPPETNVVVDTNPPPMVASNPPVAPPPPVVVQTPQQEYVVVHGDTLGKIAKKNGVTLSALEAANPGVDPAKLKVGQKLTIPVGGTAPTATGGSTGSEVGMGGGETYVVKSGDTLTKIAKTHGLTVKALRAENNLTSDHIKVGEKLKLPAKAEAAAPAPAPAAPPAAPTPTPAGTPSGQ